MCEANVYLKRGDKEELLMEKVDRITVEGETIFLVSVFGERKMLKARIKEMELVDHRIIMEEIPWEVKATRSKEIWLEPDSKHGHFHPGEEVRFLLYYGYNMQKEEWPNDLELEVYAIVDGETKEVEREKKEGFWIIKLKESKEGLVTACAIAKRGQERLLAKVVIENGHHVHGRLHPAGLPLEIVPSEYRHVHLGEEYEFLVLKDGRPLHQAKVFATYQGVRSANPPHQLTTDERGQGRVMLTAPGNWLFSVQDHDTVSTFTLVKDY